MTSNTARMSGADSPIPLVQTIKRHTSNFVEGGNGDRNVVKIYILTSQKY